MPAQLDVTQRTSRRAELCAWAIVVLVTLLVTGLSIQQALERYRLLRSGWSWDLAYYNQWLWSLCHGDHTISVRPIASYATEGPSVWKTNYLAPIRFAVLPFHAVFPNPRTLLIFHSVMFWWLIPASYMLVRSETRSRRAGLAALPLVILTPLAWPLCWNDFRELQLAVPFAIWAVHGVRERSWLWTTIGVAGLLACRQEYALMVASLAIIPARRPYPIDNRLRWATALWSIGLVWFLVIFLGYLVITCGWRTPIQFIGQFGGARPGLLEMLRTMLLLLVVGMGAWSVLGMAAPRLAFIALPWLWSLASGRWAIHVLETESWHHVRYAAPFFASGLSAGLVGASRLWRFARWLPHTRWARAGGLIASLTVMILANLWLLSRFERVRYPIPRNEAAALWYWFGQVGPEEGVLADYLVAAPLSSRRQLFGYELDSNKPTGFPGNLPREINWVFSYGARVPPDALLDQGFVQVHQGPAMSVWRRSLVPTTHRGTSTTRPNQPVHGSENPGISPRSRS